MEVAERRDIKAADLGILAWRFSNENAGDRHLEQNKTIFSPFLFSSRHLNDTFKVSVSEIVHNSR